MSENSLENLSEKELRSEIRKEGLRKLLQRVKSYPADDAWHMCKMLSQPGALALLEVNLDPNQTISERLSEISTQLGQLKNKLK